MLRQVVGWLLQKTEVHTQPDLAGIAQGDASRVARRLVRDPVCGVHVDETLSIPYRDEGELLHFCSIACRDAYVSSTKKFVANA